MFVLDTDVVSELRKVGVGKVHRQVAAWREQVTLGESVLAAIEVMRYAMAARHGRGIGTYSH